MIDYYVNTIASIELIVRSTLARLIQSHICNIQKLQFL